MHAQGHMVSCMDTETNLLANSFIIILTCFLCSHQRNVCPIIILVLITAALVN